MTYKNLLTSTFENRCQIKYPNTQLSLCVVEREDILHFRLSYPQVLIGDHLIKIESLLDLEQDKDCLEYDTDNHLLNKDFCTKEFLEEAENDSQQTLQLLGGADSLKQNSEAILLLKHEQRYLNKLLEALVSPENSDQTREKGIVIRHHFREDMGRVIAWSASENTLKFRLAITKQICANTSWLIEKFMPLFNIEITPFIYFGENGIVEMFVEFEGMFLLIRIMSNSVGAKLRWREDKQEVFIYRKKGKKNWIAATKAIQKDFKSQEISIRNYTALMGTSTRQRRRPIIKVLLLEGSIVDPGNNPDYLCNDIPGHTYLNIKGNSNVLVFSIEALEIFLITVAAKKYFKRVSDTELAPIGEDCSAEEKQRRLQILDLALQKTGI